MFMFAKVKVSCFFARVLHAPRMCCAACLSSVVNIQHVYRHIGPCWLLVTAALSWARFFPRFVVCKTCSLLVVSGVMVVQTYTGVLLVRRSPLFGVMNVSESLLVLTPCTLRLIALIRGVPPWWTPCLLFVPPAVCRCCRGDLIVWNVLGMVTGGEETRDRVGQQREGQDSSRSGNSERDTNGVGT